MNVSAFLKKYGVYIILCVYTLLLGIIFWESICQFYFFLSDKEQIKIFVTSSGIAAPLVFILVQILQVIFAPVPGEATGFVGGYLFGAGMGFFYSTIGLGLGSCINFLIGRVSGVKFARKMISAKKMEKFDNLFKKQGIVVLFLLFVFPGFPKDILSMLAGVSAIPFRIFIVIATIGRMPGTFMLSLQGEFLFSEKYGILAVTFGLCLVLSIICLKYREAISLWLERNN